MPVVLKTILLLVLSNLFMTYAWYGHLRTLSHRPLLVFVPFAWLYMRQPLKLEFLWAGLCVPGAVFFMFRSQSGP